MIGHQELSCCRVHLIVGFIAWQTAAVRVTPSCDVIVSWVARLAFADREQPMLSPHYHESRYSPFCRRIVVPCLPTFVATIRYHHVVVAVVRRPCTHCQHLAATDRSCIRRLRHVSDLVLEAIEVESAIRDNVFPPAGCNSQLRRLEPVDHRLVLWRVVRTKAATKP